MPILMTTPFAESAEPGQRPHDDARVNDDARLAFCG